MLQEYSIKNYISTALNNTLQRRRRPNTCKYSRSPLKSIIMRRHFLNKILPLGVGFMAIAFAFASEGKSSDKNDEEAMISYIYNPLTESCEEVETDCSETGNVACTFNGHDVFKSKLSVTECSVPLYRWENN